MVKLFDRPSAPRRTRKAGIVVAAVAAMAATLFAAAPAATAHVQDTDQLQDTIGVQLATCTDGTVTATVNNLQLRNLPRVDSTATATLRTGVTYGCQSLVLGGRYTACGQTNGNGWIPVDIDRDGFRDGYAASACLRD